MAAKNININNCLSELKRECAIYNTDFEAALFRCSWRDEKKFSSSCDQLFSNTLQMIFYRDRPLNQHVCTPVNKKKCAAYDLEYQNYKKKFELYLKKYFKTDINTYFKIIGDYENE